MNFGINKKYVKISFVTPFEKKRFFYHDSVISIFEPKWINTGRYLINTLVTHSTLDSLVERKKHFITCVFPILFVFSFVLYLNSKLTYGFISKQNPVLDQLRLFSGIIKYSDEL